MRSVENEECGKCGVWKMRSVENFNNFPFQFPEKQRVNNKIKKKVMNHCILRCAGLGW